MSDIAVNYSEPQSESLRPRAFDTIFYGGLAIGILDICDAMIFFGLWLGISPLGIWRSVAGGVLGRQAAAAGGFKIALLGLALHFVNATLIATAYYIVVSILPVLNKYAVAAGLIYGVVVYFIMTFVVVPLSAIGPRPFPAWPSLINGLVGHALLVGLPVALIARWSAKKRSR
jgi:hypothetical protein